MSLKGSLQTVALPEVLGFLSGTNKTGELNVDGTAGKGFLWFQDGAISGVRVERGPNPVEAVFQLLRIEDGEFSFTAGATPPDDVRAVEPNCGEVASVLAQAQERMGEWQDIVAVVPSLDHRVTLVAEAPDDTVLMDRDQWSLVVAIGEGRTVEQVIAARDLGEFDGCRAVKTLVESALVRVDEPPAPADDEVTGDAVEDQPGADAVLPVDAADGDNRDLAADDTQAEPAVPAMLSLLANLSGFTAFGSPAGPAANATAGGTPAEEAVADGAHSEIPAADEHPVLAVEEEADHYASLQSMVNEMDQSIDEDGHAENDDAGVPAAELAMPAFGSEVLIGTDQFTGTADFGAAEEETSSRAALQALLDQVAGEEFPEDELTGRGDEVVDGLADRGPWTHNELASFDGWREEEAGAEVSAFHPSAESGFTPTNFAEGAEAEAGADAYATACAEPEAEEPPAPVEEPINRGLLLKFLSSVRN